LAVTSLEDQLLGLVTDRPQKVDRSSNSEKSENKFDQNAELKPQGQNEVVFDKIAKVVTGDLELGGQETYSDFIEPQHLLDDLSTIDSDVTETTQTKSKLTTQKAKLLQLKSSAEFPAVRSNSYASVDQKKFSKSSYHRSLSTRIHYMGRALERMLDNPIALRNQNDPYYHVPGMQATDINFGAVGTLLTTRIQTITRAQWYGMDNQQWMNELSVDGYSYAMRGGLGFQMNQNYYGDGSIQNYHAALTYSPKFSVSREVVLEPSIRYKMGSKQLDPTQVQTGQMVEFDRMNEQQFSNNGIIPHGRTLWYRDLGLGLMVNTRWFFAGIQQDNLFRHFDNIYSQDLSNPRRAPKHFVACVGSDYKSVRQKITISPYMVYQKEDQLSEAWAGFNFRFYWFTLGGAISSNLDPAASAGIKLKNFMLQYNMDLTQSSMLNKQLFSHQLTLRFTTKAGRVGQRLLN
jgi:type IX secretion system PorP/SprF family membrane protein